MNVAFLPVYQNPYQRLLRDALLPLGVSVTFLEHLPPNDWLRDRRPEVALLHFHWLYGLYMSRLNTAAQLARFIAHLSLARQLGYRIVWTAHNVLPHRRALLPLHAAVRRHMLARTDAVIVHCEAGRQALVKRFSPRCPIHVVPIGSYGGLYKPAESRDAARQHLLLTGAEFVYLALGNIAAYKGFDRFVAAFGAVADERDVALIAGRNRDAPLVRRLQHVAARDPRVRLHVGYVPDDEIGQYLAAADVLVAPFESIMTSSSVMVALAHGLPVVVPDLGCMPELVGKGAGIIYRGRDTAALAAALLAIKSADREAMRTTALAISSAARWDEIGSQTAAVYASCLAN